MEVLVKQEKMDMDSKFEDFDGAESFNIIKLEKLERTLNHTAFREFAMNYFRPISCQTGLLSCPHGSVKLFQGDTCVVAAVFGPVEVRMAKELPHRGAVDVLFRPKVTGMSQLASPVIDPILAERSIESILVSIFESSIHLEQIVGLGYNIILHEFEDDGNLLSACINGTTIALLDGGCALRHTVAAVTMILTKDNKLIIDPSSHQLKNGHAAIFTYAISNAREILYTNVKGHVTPQVLKIAQGKACEAVDEMFKFFHFLALKKSQNRVSSYRVPMANLKIEKVEVKMEAESNDDDESFLGEDGELTSSESDLY